MSISAPGGNFRPFLAYPPQTIQSLRKKNSLSPPSRRWDQTHLKQWHDHDHAPSGPSRTGSRASPSRGGGVTIRTSQAHKLMSAQGHFHSSETQSDDFLFGTFSTTVFNPGGGGGQSPLTKLQMVFFVETQKTKSAKPPNPSKRLKNHMHSGQSSKDHIPYGKPN